METWTEPLLLLEPAVMIVIGVAADAASTVVAGVWVVVDLTDASTDAVVAAGAGAVDLVVTVSAAGAGNCPCV